MTGCGLAPELGVIEGFYGRPWSAAERLDTLAFLQPHGYGVYLYAPKSDPFLRRRWREDHPDDAMEALAALAAGCAARGVRFGVGLSPYELYRDFDDAAKADLARKLARLDRIGAVDLAILFDDMRGDLPGLAEKQADIVHWIGARTGATRLMVCPTYYSDDPVLDRVFGRRPEAYLETLGAALDPAIDVFWTGPEVCSREYAPAALDRVAEQIRRPPTLWDNYPVNDGPVMSRHLHLRAFTGRPAALAGHVRAHVINPASQAVLSRIPALSLADSYRLGDAYDYGEAWLRAATAVLGGDLARMLQGHINLLQDSGLDRLGEAAARLRARYAAIHHTAAAEIVAWLDGAYAISREDIEAS